ncbi:MAG TPA: DUF1269 domain-containing protein [Gammaproteobacteria bacterium]|nr:DUF1269 domain-containing protein [Gammaproteobacteria bacterium]
MKRRLYFLLPDVHHARHIVNELLLARIDINHIALIANEGVELEDLPEASLLQRSDFIPALERSALLGGATGLLAGIIAVLIPGTSTIFAGWAILAGTTAAGAGIGALAGTLISVDVPNSRLAPFTKAIEQGHVLMLVDVPYDRVEEIKKLIKKHHPEVDIEGVEPTVPPFP